MKLYYFRSPRGIKNFGDDLNPWIWNRMIPHLLDDDDTLFVGIGTILNDSLRTSSKKIVFSSGYGYGQGLPVLDQTWEFHCVRGPLTAQKLGLDPGLAITDGAMLLRDLYLKSPAKKYRYSYMPHVMMAAEGSESWKKLCADLDMGYIDPRMEVEEIFDRILETEILVTEAMHGAIVAETFRVPWIPVTSSEEILSFKWDDWCESLSIRYRPNRLLPLWDQGDDPTVGSKVKSWAKYNIVKSQMKHITDRVQPTLAGEQVVNERTNRLVEALYSLDSKLSAGSR